MGGNFFIPRPPELLNGRDAPQRTLARSTNRLIANDHVDRVGMHLREVAHRDPTASIDSYRKFQLVLLVIGRHFFRGRRLAIDHQLHQSQSRVQPARIGRREWLLENYPIPQPTFFPPREKNPLSKL